MLTRVRIKNFQSLKDADIELAPFTVIVGASSSGKSAFLRALRTLMSNSNGSSFVTHGAKKSDIEIELDGNEISLQRGPGLSTFGVNAESYPKSGTSVPAEVTAALKGLPVEIEGENLNFSFQFDKPFLLDAPASKVAKVLGDLTNVTVLHDAVREANRRRLDALNKLKVRRSDLEQAEVSLKTYEDLPAQKQRLEKLRAEFTQATRIETMYLEAKALLDTIEKQRDDLKSRVDLLKSLPDISLPSLDEKAQAIRTLRTAIAEADAAQKAVLQAKEAWAKAEDAVTTTKKIYQDRLAEAGRCPVCDQEIAA